MAMLFIPERMLDAKMLSQRKRKRGLLTHEAISVQSTVC